MAGDEARVVLFIDYQNAFNGARESFHEWNPSSYTDGQFNPVKLGEILCRDSPHPRKLAGVRVYRGQPDATKQPRRHARARVPVRHLA